VVRLLAEVGHAPGAPDFIHYLASGANTAAFGCLENFSNSGGASDRRAVAVAKAVGEAVERYCSAMIEPKRLPVASFDDADFPCIEPERFALHTDEQYGRPGFPWMRFDRATPVRWTPTVELRTGRIVYAPACFVWIPYRYDMASGECPVGQSISTGMACHGSWEASVLTGLCEVVERDAFMLMWQRALALPQIRKETLPPSCRGHVERFTRTGDRVHLIHLTTDLGVPSVLAVLVSDSPERPAHVFAAAADPEPAVAARKALEELDHTRRYAQQLLRLAPCPSAEDDYAAVQEQADHIRLAADPSRRGAFEFVFASPERVDFDRLPTLAAGDPARKLAATAEAIGRAGDEAYAADLTSEDIRGLGFSVTRTLVPGLHPLTIGHHLLAKGGHRLREAPARYAGAPVGGPLNRLPHPYP